MRSLTEQQRGILSVLADGQKHNLFAYPLIEKQMSIISQLKMIWDAGLLAERGYLREVEVEGDHVWLEITAKGHAAVSHRELALTIAVRDATAPEGFPTNEEMGKHIFFMFDGCVVSGWPLIQATGIVPKKDFVTIEEAERNPLEVRWEADSSVGNGRLFVGVRYWFVIEKKEWAALHGGRFKGDQKT